MPMRPVREDVYDTAPMRPMNIRSGYEGYRRTIDRRREVIRTERPVSRRVNSRKGKKERTSGRTRYENRNSLSALIARQRSAAGKEQYFDYDLLFVIIFLMCFGLVMLYSVSFYEAQADFGNDMYYFSKQALIGVGGFIGMYLVSKLDYHLYGAFAFEIYVISMFLMALVQTPLGVTVNGARRWIGLPGNLSLQPAEITKIAVILFISYELCRLGKRAYSPKGIAQILAFGAVASAGVLFLTDNLSTAIIVAGITCILIFVSHPKTKPFLVIIGIGIAVAAVGIAILSVTVANSDNFRLQRVISWLNPEATADTGSFQVMQGLYAIGSGGLFGKGLGNSTQKLGVIPEAQNDMILVVICEELGVFGAVVIFGHVCIVVIQTDLYCEKCARSFRFADRDWDICAYRITGYFEHCCRDGTSSDNGYYVAFYQLRRNCNRIFDGGNGNCAWNFTENKIRIEKASFLMRCVIYLYVVLKTTYNRSVKYILRFRRKCYGL